LAIGVPDESLAAAVDLLVADFVLPDFVLVLFDESVFALLALEDDLLLLDDDVLALSSQVCTP
jgi:hypothetical protein